MSGSAIETIKQFLKQGVINISSQDFQSFEGCNKFVNSCQELIAQNCPNIHSTMHLDKLVNLHKIDFTDTPVRVLNGLRNTTKLTSVILHNCPVESLKALEHNYALLELDVSGSNIADADAFK